MNYASLLRSVEMLERRPAPGKGPCLAILKDGDLLVAEKLASLALAKAEGRRCITTDIRSPEERSR